MTTQMSVSRKRRAGANSDENMPDMPAKKAANRNRFEDAESVREQARPHRILTARMPVHALTSAWTLGQNRPVDTQHVRRLCDIFARGGLNRTANANHLQVLSSRAETSRMMQYLESSGAPPLGASATDGILSFENWLSVNKGKLVEIMAGQHRIKALEAYVQQTRAGDEELWWTCEFYDRDTLPPDLNLKLRVNRQDPALADSHGQIWVQVVAASSQVAELFEGKCADVERQIMDVLQLNGDVKFPVRRLVTVWRNERWRAMTTRWCETRVGTATFQISTWEWMIGYRIDDFWFNMFRNVLYTLSNLLGKAANDVDAADWKRMADSLPVDRKASDVRKLFYPGQASPIVSGTSKRRANFLAALDDRGYWDVYERILENRLLRFPDVHRLVRVSKDEGRVLFLVMSHVVAWLNPEPATIVNRRDNNKPPLRNDLVPALQHCSNTLQSSWLAEKMLGTCPWDETPRSAPETASILLQQEVLEYILARIDSFKSPSAKAYLEQFPKGDGGSTNYEDRFQHGTWLGVLRIVRRYVGDELLRPEWLTCKENHAKTSEPAAELAQSLCNFIKEVPEFAQNSALNSQLDSAAFRTALATWFSRFSQHRSRIEVQAASDGPTSKHANKSNKTNQEGPEVDDAVGKRTGGAGEDGHGYGGTDRAPRFETAKKALVPDANEANLHQHCGAPPPHQSLRSSPPSGAGAGAGAGGRCAGASGPSPGTLNLSNAANTSKTGAIPASSRSPSRPIIKKPRPSWMRGPKAA